jgi:hypothetical protein
MSGTEQVVGDAETYSFTSVRLPGRTCGKKGRLAQ